jgi:hypothetical protein
MRLVPVFMCVLALASSARAQDQGPPGSRATGARSVSDDALREGRDPFAPLIAPRNPERKAGPVARRPGLAGLAVSDAIVTGILRNGSTTIAVIEGPGPRSYVAHNQDRLSDGEVRRIDTSGVAFAIGDSADVSRARPHEVYKELRFAGERRR